MLEARKGGSPWGLLCLLGLAIILPVVVRPIVAAEIWVVAIAAMALNVLFGYTGLLSFGQASFFGLGAYSAGLLMIHWQAPLLVCLAAGTILGALAAAFIGWVCIQRVGLYFVMLTFGFNQVLFFTAYKWTDLTGGDDGLPGIPRPPLAFGPGLTVSLESSLRLYIFVTVVFFIVFVLVRHLVRSPLGLVWMTIRENPGRAAAIGYNVALYKWLSFTIAGALSGLSGVLYAMMFGVVPLEVISWVMSGDLVFMVIIGGIGNVYGPVIGAAVYQTLSEVLAGVWIRWPMILGVALAGVVLFARGGLVEVGGRIRLLLARAQ
jgi:branched-chain amino acid transport system permease protein